MLTKDVVRFTRRNAAVLTIASCISAAGFLWPFFYSGENLPRTQIFFWLAITVAVVLTISEVSNSHLDAKSVALLGVLAALVAALRPLGAGDTLRTEMGYPLHGHELSSEITPVQASASWAIGWDIKYLPLHGSDYWLDCYQAERQYAVKKRLRCS